MPTAATAAICAAPTAPASHTRATTSARCSPRSTSIRTTPRPSPCRPCVRMRRVGNPSRPSATIFPRLRRPISTATA
ncbi:Uncharacterised protein [Bordetella pertussis]|nr:Uncharacterised protein [Bordetella pertussis]